MKSIPAAAPQDVEPDRWPTGRPVSASWTRSPAGQCQPTILLCRHCGEPTGPDGIVCRVPLEEGETPHDYAVHSECQLDALEQLAATSHEDISRWRLTATGVAVLAQAQRSNEGGAR